MRRLWLAAIAATLAGCSQLPAPSSIEPAPVEPVAAALPGEPGPEESAAPAQTLYRVRYEGREGSGSLRLVLRQVAAERFQLQAADTFGRAAWSLDLDGDEVLLVDHRQRAACVAGGELRVPELALRPLPLPAVARVLASRTPQPVPAGADRTDWTDDTGQRWTALWEDHQLVSWTLWQEDQPQLWWSRQPRGGILSHRDGSQFRWRQTAREDLPANGYRRLEVPAGYDLGECGPEAARP